MSDLQIALTQSRYALLASFRTPRTVVFGMAFPVVLLVMFNSTSPRACWPTRSPSPPSRAWRSGSRPSGRPDS